MPTVAPRTFTEALAAVVASHAGSVAVRTLDDSERLTWPQLNDRALRLAGGLRDLGVGPGDTVCLLLDNQIEFFVSDLGAVLLGAVPVSIYATSSPEQIEFIVRDAGSRVIITQPAYLDRVLQAVAGVEHHAVVCVDFEPQPGYIDFDTQDDPYEAGAIISHEQVVPFAALEESEPLAEPHAAQPDDLLTIIYTSGTTGPPKGVELTHGALLAATDSVGTRGHLDVPDGRVISWLPLAHIAERVASYYAAIYYALQVTVCPVPTQVAAYLPAVRPTFFFAVPRFWEKLRAGLQLKIASMPEEAQAAIAAGHPETLAMIRAAVGLDAVKTANVGAAPSAPEVIEFFHSIGIPLAEIYGMTENCACCTCNPGDAIRIGSVGLAQKGVELRIADDGEVLMRGPVTTRGYRHRSEANAELFTADGWLQTGDIGRLDEDGYLWIVDRKKELMINASGKNMSPANIESAIKSKSPLIATFCVIGDARPYNVALVTLDLDLIGEKSPDDPALRAAVQAAVDAGNATLARVEQVRKFAILTTPWAPGGTELTPTQKLKRRPIAEAHAVTIDALYAESAESTSAPAEPSTA